MSMIFRKASPKDDLVKIAQLIYYTDDIIYPYWFGSIENCQKEMPPLLTQNKFFFNVNNLYIAIEGQEIVGLVCIVDKNTDLNYDYTELRNFSSRYEFTIDHYLKGLIDEVNNADFAYIANVCVDPNYRDLHIGTFMLESLITEYKSSKYDELVLDVLADNPRAIHLYEKMGFSQKGEIYHGFSQPGEKQTEVMTMTNKIN